MWSIFQIQPYNIELQSRELVSHGNFVIYIKGAWGSGQMLTKVCRYHFYYTNLHEYIYVKKGCYDLPLSHKSCNRGAFYLKYSFKDLP